MKDGFIAGCFKMMFSLGLDLYDDKELTREDFCNDMFGVIDEVCGLIDLPNILNKYNKRKED